MIADVYMKTHENVALRKESVDRNNDTTQKKENQPDVALRKESVDRNTQKKHPLT